MGERITFRSITETLSGTVLSVDGGYLRVSSCRGIMWIHTSEVVR